MQKYWTLLNTKFEALNKRERMTVSAATLLILIFILHQFLLAPVLAKQQKLDKESVAALQKLDETQQKVAIIGRGIIADPDTEPKRRIAELKSLLNAIDGQISELNNTMIKPDRMTALLGDIIKDNGQLKLVKLVSLPTIGITANVKSNEPALMFKHGFEVTVEGRYLDLMEYVSAIEHMPWQITWNKAELDSSHYPTSQLTLTIHTLSLDKSLLSI